MYMAFKGKALKRYIRLSYVQTLPTGVDVDNMWEEWKQRFHAALDKVAPRVTKIHSHKRRHCPWMTKELLNLIHKQSHRPSAHRQIRSQKLKTDCKTSGLAQQNKQSLSPVKELPFQRQVVALPYVTSSIVDYHQIHHKQATPSSASSSTTQPFISLL